MNQPTIQDQLATATLGTSPGKLRAYADNVVVVLETPRDVTASGLHLPQNRQERRTGARRARVVAVGPGHSRPSGVFVPTEVKAGEVVLVDAMAGQDYTMDLTVPRHNKAVEWGDARGQFRIVREDEILGVVEQEAA